MLKVTLLVACILIFVASILYTFFWNRLFGATIGLLVRLVLWNAGSSSAWVDIGSIHISLLAGRILIKDFHYHSSNQSIRVLSCRLNWRYWLRRPAEVEDFKYGYQHTLSVPCRIDVAVEGLELFLYNRTAAFEELISRIHTEYRTSDDRGLPLSSTLSQGTHESVLKDKIHTSLHASLYPPIAPVVPLSFRVPEILTKATSWLSRQLPDLDPKSLLPFSFSVSTGAITCGNRSSENIILAQFRKAAGTYGIVESKSSLDRYKQILRIAFDTVMINCIENEDFWNSQTSIGEDLRDHLANKASSQDLGPRLLFFKHFNRFWRNKSLSDFVPRMKWLEYPLKKGKRGPDIPQSHVGADFSVLEYAIERRLLETRLLELSYYADVAGEVPACLETEEHGQKDLGWDAPPEWGMDLVIHGGLLKYGPWADRQRVAIQRCFFPQNFSNHTVTPTPQPGDLRRCDSFNIFLELKDNATLQIPFREASKNWQWDDVISIHHANKEREAASIQIKAGNDSTIKYTVPMIANESGFRSSLDASLREVSVTSSLNDIQLLASKWCRITADMPSPLEWDAERIWTFKLNFQHPVLYLLRDHINMLTDLGKDWASGPPSNFYTWVPAVYMVELSMTPYEVNLYANDQNIIDRPLNKGENTLMTLHGSQLRSQIRIPSNLFRAESTCVSFSLTAPGLGFRTTLPRWNTYYLHESSLLNEVARIQTFELSGSFLYYSETRPDFVDNLKLDIKVSSPAVRLQGWHIRLFMVLRDNYFGSFTHFSTTQEYLSKRSQNIPVHDRIDLKYRPGKSNTFQVDVGILVQGGLLMIPAALYGYELPSPWYKLQEAEKGLGSCTILQIPHFQVLVRLHDYFMEMSLNSGPISIDIKDFISDSSFFRLAVPMETKLHIRDLAIVANRLFGPQPHTSTYVCEWEICLGQVKWMLTLHETSTFVKSISAFLHNFTDPYNSPAEGFVLPLDPDVTFLKVGVESVDGLWISDLAVLRAMLPSGLNLNSNDLSTQSHSKLSGLRVPSVEFQVFSTRDFQRRWLEVASVRAGLTLKTVKLSRGWKERVTKQQQFLIQQDSLTKRAVPLYGPQNVTLTGATFRVVTGSGSLRLPTVEVPSVHNILISNNQEESTSTALPSTFTYDAMALTSDSEDGPYVSEFDRDAQIAGSRPYGPPSALEGDESQSLSSADESDEVGSDGTSDGDFSDSDEEETPHPHYHLSPYYNRFCKAYLPRSKSLSTWGDYLPFQDPRPSSIPDQVDTNLDDHDRDDPRQYPHPISTSDPLSEFTVSVSAVDVFATPALAATMSSILDTFYRDNTGLELSVDSLLANLDTSPPRASEQQITRVDLSSVRVTMVQDIMSLHDAKRFQTDDTEVTSSERETRVISVLETHVSGIRYFVCNTPHSGGDASNGYSLGGLDIRGLSLALGSYNSPPRSRRRLPVPTPVFRCSGTPSSLEFGHGALKINIGIFKLQLKETSPEIAIATVKTIGRAFRKAVKLRKFYAKRSLDCRRSVVYHLANHPNDSRNNLLSTIQPSFLVQSGRPDRLRQNPSWRLLFRLRTSLHYLPHKDYNHLASIVNTETNVSTFDFDEAITGQPNNWILDGETLTANDLSDLYSILRLPEEDSRNGYGSLIRNRLAYLSLRSHGFQVTYRDLNDSYNEINLSTINVQVNFPKTQFIPTNPSASRATSLRWSISNGPGPVVVAAALELADVQIRMFPSIIPFLQHILQVQRLLVVPKKRRKHGILTVENISQTSKSLFVLHLTLALNRFCLQAAADQIIFMVSSEKFFSTVLLHDYPGRLSSHKSFEDVSAHVVFQFQDVSLKANETAAASAVRRFGDTLAAIVFSQGSISAVFRQEPIQPRSIRCTGRINDMVLSVPRSALRLYHFIGHWRQKYLPAFELMMQELFNEIRQQPRESPRQQSRSPIQIIQLNIMLPMVTVSLQVMQGTWLSWRFLKTTIYLLSNPVVLRQISYSFGLSLGSQVLSISVDERASSMPKIAPPGTSINLELPSIQTSGSYDGTAITARVLVDFVRINVKPTHWDAVLAVQQKFGQDFNDVLLFVSESARKRREQQAENPRSTPQPLALNLMGKLKGFRVGLEGPTSTLFLECEHIVASAKDDQMRIWKCTLSDLVLSLSPRAFLTKAHPAFNRQHRSAFVVIDVLATNHRLGTTALKEELLIDFSKLQAVMQPSSIGEIGEFIDHLQTDILLRKEERKHELDAFKEKARDVLRTFNVNSPTHPTQKASFFAQRIVQVVINRIGIAFPLVIGRKLEVPSTISDEPESTRAFLISIHTLKFISDVGESGRALIEMMAFQFVPHFRQSVPADFSMEAHAATNRLVYSEMIAEIESHTSTSHRTLKFGARVDSFLMDIDSHIPDYVFSLIDVYRHGKIGVEKLAAGLPKINTQETQPATYYNAISTTLHATVQVGGGHIRMHGIDDRGWENAGFIRKPWEGTKEDLVPVDAETFVIPPLSLWVEYKTLSREVPDAQALELTSPSVLIIQALIHGSDNDLRPVLLPFFTEITRKVEDRFRSHPAEPVTPDQQSSTDTLTNSIVLPPAFSTLEISFSLRIDGARVRVHCRPDVNVMGMLDWQAGAFFVNVSPGAHSITVSGSLLGLSADLKHGFLTDKAFSLEARNLAFNVAFSNEKRRNSEKPLSFISIIVDTGLAGSLRLSRLQDILCFKAIWLDRVPILATAAAAQPTNNSVATDTQPTRRDLATIVAIRIRQLELKVDLGQSISLVTLMLRNVRIQSRLIDDVASLSVTLAHVDFDSVGNLSGYARAPDVYFQTTRRQITGAGPDSMGKMLELELRSGALDVMLESDQRWILQYNARSIEAKVYDDWIAAIDDRPADDPQLQLVFSVKGATIIALMTLETIPKLITYVGKFRANLETQKENAIRESEAFRFSRLPKPQTALSEVANAMIQSARSKLKEYEQLSYSIKQQINLDLEELIFVLFPRASDDITLARFQGRNIVAQLKRNVDVNGIPHDRDLSLALSQMTISQLLRHPSSIAPVQEVEVLLWARERLPGAHENAIFKLPAMKMIMISHEEQSGVGKKTLQYEFFSKFTRLHEERDLERISITFNLALYSWLADLRETFTRELKRAQDTVFWRSNQTSEAVDARLSPIMKMERDQIPKALDTIKSKDANDGSASQNQSKQPAKTSYDLIYVAKKCDIERLTVHQLGAATPDVRHPFFTRKAGFNLETSLPQYVHEYATLPVEEIMRGLLKIYSKQLQTKPPPTTASE